MENKPLSAALQHAKRLQEERDEKKLQSASAAAPDRADVVASLPRVGVADGHLDLAAARPTEAVAHDGRTMRPPT